MAHKSKVAYKIKVEIVRQVLNENISLAEAANNAGVNVMVVKGCSVSRAYLNPIHTDAAAKSDLIYFGMPENFV